MEQEINVNYESNMNSPVIISQAPFSTQESLVSFEKFKSFLNHNTQDDYFSSASDFNFASSRQLAVPSYKSYESKFHVVPPQAFKLDANERNFSHESSKGFDPDIKTIYSEKYKYVGQVNSLGKRHGFGICYYKNGDKYSGQFSNDKKEGFGRFFSKAGGKVFNGEFKQNTIDGFVEYIQRNQSVQMGIMKNLKFINKEAIIVHQSNFDMEGVIEYGPKEQKTYGIVRIKYKNKNVYEGETVENHECGWGILHRTDGYIIKGEKSEGKYNGYCEIDYPDGSKYYGWCMNSQQSGIGITITSKGEYTIGNYIHDLKDGGFLVCLNGFTRLELYLQGFLTKIIDNKEAIISYITLVYPEYIWLCTTKNQHLADFLIKLKFT